MKITKPTTSIISKTKICLILIITTVWLKKCEGFLCKNQPQPGLNKISILTTKPTPPDFVDLNVEVLEYPREVSVAIYDRWRYSHYCFTNFLYKQTCEEKERRELPDKEELKRWEKIDGCLVGKTCSYWGECWASDSTECTKDYRGEYNIVGENKPITKGFPRPIRLRYSCSQYWRCSFSKGYLPLYITLGAEGDYTLNIPMKNGDLVPISNNMYDGSMNSSSGEGIIKILDSPPTPKISEKKIRCYNNNVTIACYITGLEETGLETAIKFTQKPFSAVYRNFVVRATQLPQEIECSGELTTISHRWCLGREGKTGKGSYAKVPDLQDIMSINEEISVQQMIHSYSLAETQQKIIEIGQLLQKVVEEISKKDNLFLGKLMRENFMTSWINDEFFKKYQCQEIEIKGNSNCDGKTQFENGFLINNKDRKKCRTYDTKTPHLINVLNLTSSKSPYISIYNLEIEPGHSEVWEKYTQPNPEREFTNQYIRDELKTQIGGALKDFGVMSGLYSYITMIGSIISYLNVIIIIALICRRQ